MNESLTFSAALLAGLAGSTHCLGMCGPLAAIAGSGKQGPSLSSALLHNLGRLLSYGLMGGVLGSVGIAASNLLPGAAAGPALRGLLGMVMVLLGLQLIAPAFRYNPLNIISRKLAPPVWRRLQPLALRLGQRKGAAAQLGKGMLWGWLPCGLVYSLLALAAVSGSAGAGAGVMLCFGVGTLPAMLGVGLLGGQLKRLTGRRLRPLMGAMMIIGGLMVALVPLSHLSGGKDHSQHHHAYSLDKTPGNRTPGIS